MDSHFSGNIECTLHLRWPVVGLFLLSLLLPLSVEMAPYDQNMVGYSINQTLNLYSLRDSQIINLDSKQLVQRTQWIWWSMLKNWNGLLFSEIQYISNLYMTVPRNLFSIVIYLTSLYYRKLLCSNKHHFLSISMYTARIFICRIASKLDHRAATLLQNS